MRSSKAGSARLSILVVAPLMALLLTGPVFDAGAGVTLASVSASGANSNGSSSQSSLSSGGERVAFMSIATNLHPGDEVPDQDMYVKDLVTGEVFLASSSSSGKKAEGGVGVDFEDALSADGTMATFATTATNLDPKDQDATSDIYVKNLATGELVLASVTAEGVKSNGGSHDVTISGDGTRVAFSTRATNLDSRDSDSQEDVYVKDLVTGALHLASTSDSGVKGNFRSGNLGDTPDLSWDGTRVAFTSIASNLDPADTDQTRDVFVKNLDSGDITVACTTDTGRKFRRSCGNAVLSDDGSRVAFFSVARLDPGDAYDGEDVYVKDLVSGDVVLASSSDDGVGSKGRSGSPGQIDLTGDGLVVGFESTATNLDPLDDDALEDVYVKTLTTGDIVLASISTRGDKAMGAYGPSLSDGGAVAFDSLSRLVRSDRDGLTDVYVRDADPAGNPSTSGRKAFV